MKGKFHISAIAAAGFWRCGRHFSQAGIIVDASEFTKEQWDRLHSEPKLRISEVGDDLARSPEDRQSLIVETIKDLEADDFQNDGKPKLNSLSAILGAALGKITAAERDQAWEAVTADGFNAPSKG